MPLSPQDVFDWGDIPSITSQDRRWDLMAMVLAAVVEHVDTRFGPWELDEESDEPIRPKAVELAIVMQAFRLWKRRSTPEGVAGFGDMGVVRVSRLDPDVEELLAPYRPPIIC